MNSSALYGPSVAAAQSRLPAQVQQAMLSGNRLHLQHGPINLVIKAIGSTAGVQRAYALAAQRMEGMLQGLVDNLSVLRSPLCAADNAKINDATSQRMISTVRQFKGCFVTPMAAVAGAVADEVLAAMKNADGLDSVFVNNGGDIALHLSSLARKCVLVLYLSSRRQHRIHQWRSPARMVYVESQPAAGTAIQCRWVLPML